MVLSISRSSRLAYVELSTFFSSSSEGRVGRDNATRSLENIPLSFKGETVPIQPSELSHLARAASKANLAVSRPLALSFWQPLGPAADMYPASAPCQHVGALKEMKTCCQESTVVRPASAASNRFMWPASVQCERIPVSAGHTFSHSPRSFAVRTHGKRLASLGGHERGDMACWCPILSGGRFCTYQARPSAKTASASPTHQRIRSGTALDSRQCPRHPWRAAARQLFRSTSSVWRQRGWRDYSSTPLRGRYRIFGSWPRRLNLGNHNI
jgi:hypothetical protein